MGGWQTNVLIIENGALFVAILWFGLRFGRWTQSRDRNADSAMALVKELQEHRAHRSIDATNHAATFIHDDREETG